jgi:S1-C subfamily serine protease
MGSGVKRTGSWIAIRGFIVIGIFALVTLGVLGTPKLVNKAVEAGLASVVENVIPLVVHIQYESDKIGYYGQKIGWQGSGVIIFENGLILTARHVCEKPGRFTVTLSDGKEFVTEKACVSRDYDVGFLKIDANDLPTAEFGNSDEMRLGSRILAIGSPWGKQHFNSVTLGILSAFHPQNLDEKTLSWGWEVLFQTDVAANPGNSGGPVFNTAGEMVGIVVGLYGPGSYAGITYCVPSNVCEKLVKVAKLTFALHDVMIVEADDRVDKLEDWADTVDDDMWDIERRLDDLEEKELERERELERKRWPPENMLR